VILEVGIVLFGDGGLTSLQVAPAGAGTLGPSKLLVSGLATPTTVVELL